MTTGWDLAGSLLSGPLRHAEAPWPLVLTAVLCDLRPRFLPKGAIARGCRAVSRNGRVLLCGDQPLADLIGRAVRIRLQTWNRAALPGDAPAPHGVLLCIRGLETAEEPAYRTRLTTTPDGADLTLDVGGLQVLEFRRVAALP